MKKIIKSFVVLAFLVCFSEVRAQDSVLKPNELGKIPVLEYHHIGAEESRWTRSYENFRDDLEWLYANDYRAVSVKEFLNGKIDLSLGKKAVIITFDDGNVDQFRYLENGEIDSNSAIGIMDEFLNEHRDFGSAAVFFVNRNPFGGGEDLKKKLEYLLKTGREIGNHTIDHSNLAKTAAMSAQDRVYKLDRHIDDVVGRDVEILSIAYPFGGIPKSELKGIKIGFLVGADPSYPTYHKNFDAMRVPRIQAIDDEWKRWFRRESGATGRNQQKEVFDPYVSDGDLSVISVDDEKYLNLEKLKELGVGEKEVVEKVHASAGDEKENLKDNVGGEVVEKEKYPYQNCGIENDDLYSFKNLNYSFSFLKLAKILASVRIREIPSDLSYEDGLYFYTIKDGDSLSGIGQKFVGVSKYYLRDDLIDQIKKVNGGIEIKGGNRIVIPDVELITVRTILPDIPRKGIYFTSYTAATVVGKAKIEKMLESGGNMVVIDFKNVDGRFSYPSQLQVVKDVDGISRSVFDVQKFVEYWRRRGVYVVARIVMFKDGHLAKAKPEWSPKIRGTNKPWTNREGQVWLDPSNSELQNYYMQVIKEIAEMGVDEIQFDYIRFPAMGKVSNAYYLFYDEKPKRQKWEVIRDFVKRAKEELADYDVKLSVDVFGVIAWNNGYDGIGIGQKVECLAPYVDYIYPMVYPSHYNDGFGGLSSPKGQPYEIVNKSLKLFQELMVGTRARLRPWLQGFGWNATGYGTGYIRKQVKAGQDLGIFDFVIWNASNRYVESWGVFR